MQIVKTFFNADRTRKVDIFEREDGRFGFAALKFGVDEGAWYPTGRYSECVTDTVEAAIREATGRVAWLADERGQK